MSVQPRRQKELYTKDTGHEPETRFPDDPDWNYKGTKQEREELAQRIGIIEDDDLPVVIEGQEELFDVG